MSDVVQSGRVALAEDAVSRRSRRVAAFPAMMSAQIAPLTASSSALADLAGSFPALLVALATGHGTAAARLAARGAIERGEPLKRAAGILGLPMWLRALPAEALIQRLPDIPNEPDFGRIVTAELPTAPADMIPWLDHVALAFRLAGPEVGRWVGRRPNLSVPVVDKGRALWVLAWAFYSLRPETIAGRAIRRRWSPDLGHRVVPEELANWRRRLSALLLYGDGVERWFSDGQGLGFEFVGLTTAEDLFEESRRMRNCLDIHTAQVGQLNSRIYSVRKAGKSVANLEIGVRSDEPGVPYIVQLKGVRNQRAPAVIWQAVHAWMGAQEFPCPKVPPSRSRVEMARWRQLWEPLDARCQEIGARDRYRWLIAGRCGPEVVRARPGSSRP